MVAWSTSDEIQLRKECGIKEIRAEKLEKMLEDVIDCQRLFSDKTGNPRAYSLGDAFIMADIDMTGRPHDGLVDAGNTAKLFNTIYEKARIEETEHLTVSLGSLMSGLKPEPGL